MFNIFNIFKTENEVIASLEAKIKKLELERNCLYEIVNNSNKLVENCGSHSAKTFSHYIDALLDWSKEKGRADDLEKELKALKESNGGN